MRLHTTAKVLSALLVTAVPVGAMAETLTYDFTVTATDGSLAGTTGGGTLSFDSSLLAAPNANYLQPNMLSALSFTWNGTDFNTSNATAMQISTDGSGRFGGIVFGDNCNPSCLTIGSNPNDWLIGFGFHGNQGGWFSYSDGAGTYLNTEVTSVTATPLPGTTLLLLSGLCAFAGYARFRPRTAAPAAVPAR